MQAIDPHRKTRLHGCSFSVLRKRQSIHISRRPTLSKEPEQSATHLNNSLFAKPGPQSLPRPIGKPLHKLDTPLNEVVMRRERRAAMMYGATPDELKMLHKLVKEYCRENRITDAPDREYIALRVFTAFKLGVTSPEALKKGLSKRAAIADATRK
ncbi:hypothetical protein LGH82_03345 [Mesorhizobium sp. PAMC28654]|uniref:hypothetical protein n=1 Tax=Mesorhizobium sp. PAMC28654 TaxID=2880934 RepID=UPI001D0B9395|nr:hypothetical protein [Mesorhizobium sp. PAMC28654]UDL90420.1 hypothetical protein LGH82_03345 [Mesorhizobium sp. PAMC28654]